MFASEVVRYVGEPIAAVAADHPETCRRALAAIVVDYEVLEPLIDPELAIDGSHPPIHPDGNVFRHQRIVRGDQTLRRRRRRRGHLRDRHAGPGVPRARGGAGDARPGGARRRAVRRHAVAARGPRADRRLPRPRRRTRCGSTLGGVGGAFGAREDISLQVHTCLLALRTGRPVRIAYSREESFLGHVHRHPARDLDAPPRRPPTARCVRVEARFVLDGGAYASTSSAVLINAITHAQGPYKCDERHGRRLRGAHQQPAVRGDARLRRGAGLLRPRGADGQARRGLRPRPGRDPAAQRDGDRRPADHRPGHRERRPGRAVHPRDRGAAAARRAGRRPRRRPDAPARRRRAHRRRRPRPPRRRLAAWRSRT